MKIPTMIGVTCILALVCTVSVSAASCESLSTLALNDTTVTLAKPVPAGQFSLPGERQTGERGGNPYKDLPEFCRVAATLKPSSDSDIKIEVWLPANGWNGKFQAVGNGGWAGVISYSAMAEAVRAGYASASTDTGHVGGRGTLALGTRNDRESQGRHQSLLWQRAQVFILERLLDRWAAGSQGSAEIPGGL